MLYLELVIIFKCLCVIGKYCFKCLGSYIYFYESMYLKFYRGKEEKLSLNLGSTTSPKKCWTDYPSIHVLQLCAKFTSYHNLKEIFVFQ